jgi:hypothetical protein
MDIRSRLSRAAISSGLLVSLGYLAATPASAAPAAVHVVYSHARYHLSYLHASVQIQDISATGPNVAWALARHANSAAKVTSGWLLRYNGHRWATVSYPGDRTFFPDSVTALSPTDVWLFGFESGSGAALHYLHGPWSSFPLPADTVGAWLVLSDTDIWVAAGPRQIPGCDSHEFGPGCSAAAQWNGATWQYYPVAVSNLTSLAGTSATDIWAAGYDAVQTKSPNWLQPLAFRLTGSAFQRASLSARQTDYVPELTVLSPQSVWLGGTTPRGAPATCITHWNGQRWSAFSTAPTGYQGLCDNLVTDGHRGVWFAPEVHWTGSEFVQYLRPPITPRNGGLSEGVAVVPGSRFQWVYGFAEQSHVGHQITGYIYKLG